MQSEYIDFRQYLFAIKRRWPLAVGVFGFVILLTSVYTFLQKPVYEASGSLLIKKRDSIEDLEQAQQLNPVGKNSDPLGTEVELIRSTNIAQKTIAALNLDLKPEGFLAKLSAENVNGTDIVAVSYQSVDPEQAAIVVNQVMRLYLENDILTERTEATTIRKFMVEQLPITRAHLYRAEAALRKFEEENSIVNLEEEAKSAVAVIADLESQASKVQASLADISSQSQALQKKLGMSSQQAIAASALGESPEVQSVLTELQQVENQLATGQATYQENHPSLVNLKSKKASLETLLQRQVEQVLGDQAQLPSTRLRKDDLRQQITGNLVQLEAQRLGLTSQISALSNVLADYKRRTNALPELKQRELALEREVAAAQSTYTTLLKRLEEIKIEENRNLGNVRIVEQARIPEEPIAPNTSRNLALGNLLGILLAAGTALLLDALDTSIKTVKEAREVFGYTLLGFIPLIGKTKKAAARDRDLEQSIPKVIVRDTPCSPLSEAYRMLQANLNFLCSDKQLRVVAVTSSVPQEGKSTVSANLAVAMAQSERRVLLVDADMRQPTQHKIWEMLNEAGLSNVLVGQAEFRTVVKEVMPYLHVLTAGVTPPNPMNLLESRRMAALVENFSSSYDFVIIDTPSLSIAADAPILGKMADGILLVVRPGTVDTANAASAKEFLERSGQKVLGQVVNAVTSENKPYNSYYTREYHTEEDAAAHETSISR